MTTESQEQIPPSLVLVLFATRLSALVEEGVSFVRAFHSLRDTPEPYGAESVRLQEALEAGDTLSDAMLGRRELYSRYFIAMVHAGEVGGIIDVTLRIAADIITKEWRLLNQALGTETELLLAAPSTKYVPENWSKLSYYQRTTNMYLFCETWGSLLGSGVPILRSMDVVAELLPRVQAEQLFAAKRAISAGERINAARIEGLPPFVAALIDQGEERGTLDMTLVKAADVLLIELDALAMSGPRQQPTS
ncbi:MAG TPA: type II secretion system F family protein [Capsulimonadaceae bacterium]|jgi:type II secretory pathway component PulF